MERCRSLGRSSICRSILIFSSRALSRDLSLSVFCPCRPPSAGLSVVVGLGRGFLRPEEPPARNTLL